MLFHYAHKHTKMQFKIFLPIDRNVSEYFLYISVHKTLIACMIFNIKYSTLNLNIMYTSRGIRRIFRTPRACTGRQTDRLTDITLFNFIGKY